MVKGFRDFIAKGNVLDLAVAVVIGGAFALVIDALVTGFINPLIAAVFGKQDMSKVANFSINGSEFNLGIILGALITFLSTAAAVYFFVVVPYTKMRARMSSEAAVDERSEETKVLEEIRDLLRAQRG